MANPQPTDSHIRIANEIETELLRCKFTQRQYSILRFILRLSWGCGRKTAIIPMLKDFELCGVLKTHIKTELEHLSDMKVIRWEPNTNEFSFNKDYDQWRVTPSKGWDGQRFKALLSINLAHRNSYHFGNSVTDTDVTQLPKVEPSYQKNEVTQLPKVEPKNDSNPRVDWVPDPPISNQITNDDRSIEPQQPQPAYANGYSNIYRAFEGEFNRIPSSMELDKITQWCSQYGDDLVLRALEEAVECRTEQLTYRYVDKILLGWERKGWTSRQQVDAGKRNESGHRALPSALGQKVVEMPPPRRRSLEADARLEAAERKRGGGTA